MGDVALCNSAGLYQRFGGTCCLHSRVKRVSDGLVATSDPLGGGGGGGGLENGNG